MTDPAPPGDLPRLRLRIHFASGDWLGPGKAELLALIAETGSISAAGRRMGMSYKRAWMLVETLNAIFREPLVESARGGAKGGGASLTPLGAEVLARYRRIEATALQAGRTDLDWLLARAGDTSGGK